MADNYQAHSTAIDIARILNEIGDMLEIKGESSFKTRAYRRAAEALYNLPNRGVEGGAVEGHPGRGRCNRGQD